MVADPFRDLPDISRFTGSIRPPSVKKAPLRPTGPRSLNLGKKPRKQETSVWVVPPEGFLTAHNSVDEWQVYLAIAMHLKDPPNPFEPPFVGGITWVYQKGEAATGFGTEFGRVPGGSVSDFAVHNPDGRFLILRLQTEYRHIFTSAAIQEKDRTIDVELRGASDVIDIFSQDFIWDTTGKTVMAIVARALKGQHVASPTESRSALRVRRPRF